MRKQSSSLKRPPLLRPFLQTCIIAAYSGETPSQEPISRSLCGLDGGISSALDALPQVLEAMCHVTSALKAEVKVFSASGVGVVGSPKRILVASSWVSIEVYNIYARNGDTYQAVYLMEDADD